MKIPDSMPWVSSGKTLGSGGQAVVYLVTRRDQADSPNYALKALKNVDSRQARERFNREIAAVKQLQSPHIAKIVDNSKPEDPFQYYVMEYYEGARTLDNIIFSGLNPFHGDTLESLGLFKKLISAVLACEQSKPPIVHRDINPKNILVLPEGSIRLIDFGICQIEGGQILTLVDENVGTRNYTASECEAGNDAKIGVHSDLYSAAKVLWAIMTSQRAFAREAPVFANRSMASIFPDNPLTWHLDLIFEKTIRANPENRIEFASLLLKQISEVEYVVERKFPPLLQVARRCPSCGHATLAEFPRAHDVFGNPNPPGVEAWLCKTCGFGFVRDMNQLNESYRRIVEAE